MAFEDPFFVDLYERADGRRSEDISFYLEQAKIAAGPILDLGCGSGRLLVPLVEAGNTVVGLDSSETMLSLLRSRSPNQGAPLVHASFENLDVPVLRRIHDGYALIISSFNSFLHLMDQEAQLEFLAKVRALLRTGGRFVLDIVNPASHEMFAASETDREFEQQYYDQATSEKVESWLTIRQHRIEQTGSLNREYIITAQTGDVTKRSSVVHYRWTYPSEMRLLLRASGFENLSAYGDYVYGPLTEESENQIWIAM